MLEDGHTYYSILCLSHVEIVGMDVTRNEKFSMEEAGPEITGEKEYKFLLSPPLCMMCYYMGIIFTPKSERNVIMLIWKNLRS